MDFRLLSPIDSEPLSHLLDRCFGPARARRTAALVREGAPAIPSACMVAVHEGAIVGSVQVHRLDWCHASGRTMPLAWLGPLVSDPQHRGQGIAHALMDRSLAALDAMALPVALIGDAPFYARWRFDPQATGQWTMPGPVDRARLLLRAADPQLFAGPVCLGLPGGIARAA